MNIVISVINSSHFFMICSDSEYDYKWAIKISSTPPGPTFHDSGAELLPLNSSVVGECLDADTMPLLIDTHIMQTCSHIDNKTVRIWNRVASHR